MSHAMSRTPVNFKRVFGFASAMITGLCAALMLYVGVASAGNAETPNWTGPVLEPMTPEALMLVPALQERAVLLAPVETPMPVRLTYADAEMDSARYLAWLRVENPGVKFKRVTAVVTAYCPCTICCGADAHGVTSTGVRTNAKPYGIASPNHLVGRGVHIPGYRFESEPGRIWKIDDTGGALNTSWKTGLYHFDVRFINHDYARTWWGSRYMTVYLVK